MYFLLRFSQLFDHQNKNSKPETSSSKQNKQRTEISKWQKFSENRRNFKWNYFRSLVFGFRVQSLTRSHCECKMSKKVAPNSNIFGKNFSWNHFTPHPLCALHGFGIGWGLVCSQQIRTNLFCYIKTSKQELLGSQKLLLGIENLAWFFSCNRSSSQYYYYINLRADWNRLTIPCIPY